MSNLGMTYDPTTAERRTFDKIPNGWYPAQVIESDTKPTKNGQGERASFTWEIIEGEFANRKLWSGINYKHTNPEAQRIGQNELGELCNAAGTGPIDDTETLHFIPILVKVGVRKDDPDQNEIKGYKPYENAAPAQRQAAAPTQQRQAPAPQQQRQAAGGGSRPWSR